MRIPRWLRWMLLVPAAMGAGYLTWLLTTLAIGSVARFIGQSTADGLARGALLATIPSRIGGR